MRRALDKFSLIKHDFLDRDGPPVAEAHLHLGIHKKLKSKLNKEKILPHQKDEKEQGIER